MRSVCLLVEEGAPAWMLLIVEAAKLAHQYGNRDFLLCNAYAEHLRVRHLHEILCFEYKCASQSCTCKRLHGECDIYALIISVSSALMDVRALWCSTQDVKDEYETWNNVRMPIVLILLEC